MTAPAPGDVFLGVHVAAGAAYLGVARSPGEIVIDDPADHIRPTQQLADAPRLQDFRDRIVQELRRLSPAGVGVLRTTKFQRWSFTDAWARFSLEAAVLLAATDERVPSQHVVAEDAAGVVPCPPKMIAERAAKAWGVEPTRYWKYRAPAFAAALALARGEAR